MEFQLRLETLDFLKSPRVGNHGRNVVTNNGAPGSEVLIVSQVSTKVPRQYTESFSSKDDWPKSEAANLLLFGPVNTHSSVVCRRHVPQDHCLAVDGNFAQQSEA